MRHNKKINHLGRKTAHRGAMLSNMSASLIMHKRIFTTVAKAKALKKVVEPIITRSKEDTTHSRRIVFSTLQSKEALTELFQNVSQKVGDRPGGYTRIIKTGHRLGDNAAMCFIELVDYNENMLKDSSAAKKPRTRRSRRKATDSPVVTNQNVDKAKTKEPVEKETDKVETPKAKEQSKTIEPTSNKDVIKPVATDEVKPEKPAEPKNDKE